MKSKGLKKKRSNKKTGRKDKRLGSTFYIKSMMIENAKSKNISLRDKRNLKFESRIGLKFKGELNNMNSNKSVLRESNFKRTRSLSKS